MDQEGLQLDFTDLNDLRSQIPHMSEGELVSALQTAASMGDEDAVALFAQAIKPGCRGTGALVAAMEEGHVDIVRQLIHLYGTTEDYDHALVVAAWVDNPDVVQALLQVSDPTACNYEALREAALGDKDSALELIAARVNVDTVILDELVRIQRVHAESFKLIDKLMLFANPATRANVAAALLQLCPTPTLAQYYSGQTTQTP